MTCVCFPEDQLQILPYARVVKGLNGLTEEEFLERLKQYFVIRREGEPERKGEFVMYLSGERYHLTLREGRRPACVPESLDVAVMQQMVLGPILGISDPQKDIRLEFVGGLHQQEAVEEKCAAGDMAGFLFFPTSMEELMEVADAGEAMPPKSTWFEPKLCNGLFIHRIGEMEAPGSTEEERE